MREDARLAAERSLSAVVTLRAARAALDAAGIAWLLWKGPALSAQVWGDAARRHFSDLDLVVAPSDRLAAREALGAAGWRSRDRLTRAQERAIHGRTAAFPLLRDGSTLVELHWEFGARHYPRLLDAGAVLARAERVRIGGVDVLTPGGADALLLLAAHATKHGWSQAEEVLSFVRLAEREPAALAQACAAATAADVAPVMELALELSRRLVGVAFDIPGRDPEPGPLIARLADESVGRMCAGASGWRESHRWTLAWIRRPSDRVHYAWSALLSPTPQEWQWLRLPGPLVPLYPVVRLARLALRTVGLVR